MTENEISAVMGVSFKVTTYVKRARGAAGPTQIGSKRLSIAEALQWVLQELPDEAWEVQRATPENGDTVTLTVDWTKVPDRGMWKP